MRGFIACALFGAVIAHENMTVEFLRWAAQHGKEYKNLQDFELRLTQFIRTSSEIAKFNHNQDKTSTVGHNKFSDWT